MNLPEQHFKETKRLASSLGKDLIAKWLLNYGYYPENYVLPPTFRVKGFELRSQPYYSPSKKQYKPLIDQIVDISFPKSLLTVRTYGIVNPKIYHDLVYYIVHNWKEIVDLLFHDDLNIYSYSFPLPVVKNNLNKLSELRSGRMIYEFIEMAENDLVSEAHKYSLLVKSDISNFYPSIYTHSLAWAIHSKEKIRQKNNRNNFDLFGNCIDKLLQNSNDGCTNGLPVGSALSDLISELLLAFVDRKSSKILRDLGINFIAVRFKDDYRILCKSRKDATEILRVLQSSLAEVNLTLSESKTSVKELPEGLYREWTSAYRKITLKYKPWIRYKTFEETLLSVLEIDRTHPGTGLIDRFLSDITTDEGKLKTRLNPKERRKFLSLLLLLKSRRPKSFPKILALIELIYVEAADTEFKSTVIEVIGDLLNAKLEASTEDEYELIWLYYFSRKILGVKPPITTAFKNQFIESIRLNEQHFFSDFKDASLFSKIEDVDRNLYQYLKIFA